jgi:hypothetical protein
MDPVEEQLDETREQLTNLVYWFPILQKIRMRVPRTSIVYSGDIKLSHLLDGEKPVNFETFMNRIDLALEDFKLPVFLRTGMTSDKHNWKNTCFLKDKRNLTRQIRNLIETSYLANIAGYPFNYDFWVIREMIETEPIFTYFAGEMPITKEFRFFIKNGKIQCFHPYWPDEAFQDDLSEEQKKKLKEIQKLDTKEKKELFLMTEYIAKFFKDYWSVDFLKAKNRDWYVIDMAVGERSYHWKECKYAKK